MKKFVLLGLAIVSIPISVTPVSACYCGRPIIAQAFRQSVAVFVGDVVEISGPQQVKMEVGIKSVYKIRFLVWELWKGTNAIEIEVLSAQSEASCFDYPPLKVGETYLVFTDPIPPNDLSPGIQGIITNCNLTTRFGGPTPRSDVDRGNALRDMFALDRIIKGLRSEESWVYYR